MVRFDKPCLHVGGAVNYFRVHMAKRDYLSQHGQEELTWVGEGAKQLGLSGQIHEEQFARLCEGKHPETGEKLGVRQKGPIKRVCYFGQISPPKDVSIAHLVGGDERIADWWKEAVTETLQEIEAVTAARIRKGGIENQDRYTGKMVGAIVTHDASRALDPQLHTHVCIMNITYDDVERQWKSVQPEGYYQHQGYFREVCYNKLAERMVEAGYEIERERKIGFHIKGFPSSLRDQFSKRREEIERVAEETGDVTQDGKQRVAGISRAEKVIIEPQELRRRWREASGSHLDDVGSIIGHAQGERRTQELITADQAMNLSASHVFERNSVMNERALLREALIYGRGDVSREELKNELETRINRGDLIREGSQIVSREGLAMEQEYLAWASAKRRGGGVLGNVANLAPELSEEQREAVTTILQSRGSVMILQGKAGTGKTRTLREIVKGIERGGNDVFACAPSSGATEVLRKELTPKADTLQQLLVNNDLQQRMKNKVIIVDEAGLISTEQMRDLCRIAKEHDNRLLLIGDIGQHNSVQAGDALRALQTYGKVITARLFKIRRQRDPAFRRAVSLLADKKAREAFEEFSRLGALREIRDIRQLMQTAVEDYVTTIKQKKSCLVISPVWSDIHRFTSQLRPELKAAGLLAEQDRSVLTFHSYQWTEASRRDYRHYQKGDVMAFYRESAGFQKGDFVTFEETFGKEIVVRNEEGRRFIIDPIKVTGFDVGVSRSLPVTVGERLLIRSNSKEDQLVNGSIVEVCSIEADGTIFLADRCRIPPSFRQFSHGYATTSHAAQGKTVDRGIVLITGEGAQAANLQQAYVSHSRFTDSHMTYTTNQKAAVDQMVAPAVRSLGIEVTDQGQNLQRRGATM